MKKYKWLVPTLYIIFLMLPIYWLINMSFKTTTEIINTYSLWPQKLCMLNALGHLKKAVGNLDRVNKCIKIIGYINANENFEKHPIILNAASDLLVNIFGERGKHARAVVGVKSLPLGATLEIESLFEIN